MLAQQGPGGHAVPKINIILDKLVKFYRHLIDSQKRPNDSPFPDQFNFYGARDFYHLKFCCDYFPDKSNQDIIELIVEAIFRNFGGLTKPQFTRFLFPINLSKDDMLGNPNMSPIHLIKQNILQSRRLSLSTATISDTTCAT